MGHADASIKPLIARKTFNNTEEKSNNGARHYLPAEKFSREKLEKKRECFLEEELKLIAIKIYFLFIYVCTLTRAMRCHKLIDGYDNPKNKRM